MNYQKKLDEILEDITKKNITPKLLLHACCAPCSSYVIEYLSKYFSITIYYYNPNIYPENEYQRRINELKKFINNYKTINKVTFIEEEYNQKDYYNSIKGLEKLGERSERCYNCYKLRMEKACEFAKNNNYDYFTTTLSISPYKDSNWINEIGEYLENKYNIKYLYSDFKKKNGYKKSLELSKEYGLYRQDYCGCVYSKEEREILESKVEQNQFERLELLIGNKIDLIKNKKVLVIGLGGVGSYAVEALIRSGIENITIVDNDTISKSNLNRQLMTYQNNIGKYKTDEIENRIHSINPNCKVNKITEFITISNINQLFESNIDYVIDACDTISVKLELIRICKRKKIKFISSMGTGNKMDPSRLKIMDIKKTNCDPIAKIIRKMVNVEKINGKVMVVCSDEVPYTKVNKLIPSNSFVPATAGLLCASFVINDIVGDKNV